MNHEDNEIGKYDGNKLFSIPSGSNAMLVIEADGNWKIESVKSLTKH